jgi:hypothetical protein
MTGFLDLLRDLMKEHLDQLCKTLSISDLIAGGVPPVAKRGDEHHLHTEMRHHHYFTRPNSQQDHLTWRAVAVPWYMRPITGGTPSNTQITYSLKA